MSRKDMYQEVTNIILGALHTNTRPWLKPWDATGTGAAVPLLMPRRHNGEHYNGINILVLWSVAQKKGYANPYWMTYRQAKELGGQVRKGEKSAPVFYAGKLKIEDDDPAPGAVTEDGEKFIHYMKSYRVFNAAQIDGLPEEYDSPAVPEIKASRLERIPAVEDFISHTGAVIRPGNSRAFYDREADYIALPDFEAFHSTCGYYSTAFHELAHWTGHTDRLDRMDKIKTRRSAEYAFEELIAEISAAFLCADQGIQTDFEGQHAAYIQSWIKLLQDDKKAIFRAASMAQKAADYLHGLQPEYDPGGDGDRAEDEANTTPAAATSQPEPEQVAYQSVPPAEFEAVKLEEQLHNIRRKYGRDYHRAPAALHEAAALWGFEAGSEQIRDFGTLRYETERLDFTAGPARAEIWLAETPNGKWVISVGFMTPTRGMGEPLSVWDCEAFDNGDCARKAALQKLYTKFEKIAYGIYPNTTETERRYSRQMLAELEAAKTPQLALF